MWMSAGKRLSSGQDMTISLKNSDKLWLLVQNFDKTKPLNVISLPAEKLVAVNGYWDSLFLQEYW